MFTEALQHPVMIPDGGSLIFTGRKVTLQLRDTKTDPVAELFIVSGRKKKVLKSETENISLLEEFKPDQLPSRSDVENGNE